MAAYLRVGGAILIALAVAPMAAAQQSVDYASVGGRVTDPSGAVIPGAEVRATHRETNLVTTTESSADGRFRFPYLKAGPYEVVVRHPGCTDVVRSLTLAAGAAFELPVLLTVAGVEADVTVNAEATLLEAARSQIAGTVSKGEIERVPLNGRGFLELALLVPGVAPASIPSTQLFPETSAVPGVSLSVSSQRNLSNGFIVDGLSANDDAAGLSGMTYGVDAVEQVQVVTSGGQAELGRALGGYVNLVTRSGTNVLRGTAYEFARSDRLNAPNALSGTKLPMRQSQYGASVGGPVLRNRTFYFTNVEQRRLNATGLVTIAPGAVDAINARLAATGYQGPLVRTGEYANPVGTTNLLAKLDHEVGPRSRLGVRYSLYDASATHARGAGGLAAPSASSRLDNLDQAAALSHTFTLSPAAVLETRAQLAYSDLSAEPTDRVGPAVSIAGVASFGRLSSSPTARLNRLVQVVNTVSYQAGAHAFRAGVDVLHNDDRIAFPRTLGGSYTFSSLANFLAGTYSNAGFAQTFGATDVALSNPNAGFFAQDEWKVHSRVTLNLGLRYDLQFLETIRTDANNVSPRIGVAWSPFASRRTLVRGGAGLYYDRVPLRALANALLSAGNTTDLANLRQVIVTLSPAQAAAPAFPDILDAAAPSVTLPNLTTMDRDLQNAVSRQASVEIEQQLGDRTAVSAGYHYLRGLDLLMAVNQNVPTCPPAGTNNGCRPVALYANNSQYSSAGESTYHGLHISFVQRPARWGGYRVSYTLSKAMNNLGEFFFSSPIDPFDLAKDWGRSDNDQRHRLAVNGALQAPASPGRTPWQRAVHGFRLSGMLQAYSAPPFNIVSGVTTIHGTAGRPIAGGAFIPRNAGTGTRYFSASLRVSRAFRVTGRLEIEALAEAFNLTNHVNVVARNTTFGSGAYPGSPLPAFGRITAVGEPRALQLGVRAKF